MTTIKTRLSISKTLRVAIGALSTTTSIATAEFTNPSWPRPADTASASSTRSTYQFFDVFFDENPNVAGIQTLTPDLSVNPNGTASVEETNGGFVTSTGNIYSPFSILNMTVRIPGYTPRPESFTKFLVQIQTLGGELVLDEETSANDFSAFSINGVSLTSLSKVTYKELSRLPGQGSTVDHSFAFTLPTTAAQYVFNYRPLGTSVSQAGISVDTLVYLPGDFDLDGDRDSHDIDLLLRAVPGTTPPAQSLFDLNEDGSVGPVPNVAASDADDWVRGLELTEYGDSDLDGRVDFDDLLVLAQSYGQSTGTWAHGDFDGSDSVNFDDLLLLAQNYGFGTVGNVVGSNLADDWDFALSIVPEPTSLAVISGIALGMARRGKRGAR